MTKSSFAPPIQKNGSQSLVSKWFEKDLDKKANRDWAEARFVAVDTKLNGVENDLLDIKSLAISAGKKAEMPHECLKQDLIEKTAVSVENWTKWWRSILISVIGFIVVIGGSWLYQYFTLTQDVSDTRETVDELKVTVKSIEASQTELNNSFKRSEENKKRRKKEEIDELRSALRDVLREQKKNKDK